MGPPPELVPQSITLSEALDRYLRGHESETFPVADEEGRVVGVLTFESAASIGRESPLRPVRDAMLQSTGIEQFRPDDPLDRVVPRMAGSRLPALVVEGGRVVGQIALPDVDRWLRARALR